MNTQVGNSLSNAGAMMKMNTRVTTPFTKPPDPFADAEAALRNALWHTKRFKHEADPEKWLPLSLGKADSNGTRTCTLHLNRQALIDLKPIIFDMSVNIIHALDLTLAGCIRMNRGTPRKPDGSRGRSPYFPIGKTDTEFESEVRKITDKNWIDSKHADAIRSARKSSIHTLKSLAALKEIANSCKHWELAAANGEVCTVAVKPMNGQKQRFVDIAPEEFMSRGRYDFIWPREIPTDVPVLVVLSLTIEVELNGKAERFDADSIFDRSQKYVRATIDSLRQV